MSTSIKVVLFTSKTFSNGEHPIGLRVTKNRKTKYHFIGHSCQLKFWDTKLSLPNKKHSNQRTLIALIDKIKSDANKILMNLENEEVDFSSDTIVNLLIRNQSNLTVLSLFEEKIAQLEEQGRIGTANVFKSTKNNVKSYLKNKDVVVSQINYQFLKKWEEWLNAKGNKLNSDFVHLRTFKTLLNDAKRESLVNPNFDPFKEFSFKKYRGLKTEKKALTKDQINKLIKLKLPEDSRLNETKNLFLFSYYTKGMNFTDMAFLKWNQIESGILKYTRKKTTQDFKFRLIEPVIEILQYYKSFTFKTSKNYVFPVLNEKHVTPKSIDSRIDKVLKTVNSDLKVIAELIGIDANLTFYAARHSAASIMKKSGVSETIISESLGHTSEKTTRIYLSSFDDDVLFKANQVLI